MNEDADIDELIGECVSSAKTKGKEGSDSTSTLPTGPAKTGVSFRLLGDADVSFSLHR